MKRKIFRYIFVLLIIVDLFYSFVQHYHMCLDGDLAIVALPSDGCTKVLTDPFGFSALKGEHYFAPNRFFAHASTYAYFNTVPFFCQIFVSPIDSLYVSSALAKIGIQIFILWLLSVYICGSWNIRKREFILSAVLITPMFQTWGFGRYLGIIDQSITYTFFYILPLGLVLLFFLPFYLSHIRKKPIHLKPLAKILLILLTIVIALNGPLNAPVSIIISALLLLQNWLTNYFTLTAPNQVYKVIWAIKKIPTQLVFFTTLISVLCVYSFYIGTFNDAFVNDNIPLLKRYFLLPKGLYYQFTNSAGLPLLMLVIAINCLLLLKQRKKPEVKSLFNRLKWIVIFSGIYILLIPLGGYRAYRPFIIRYDTFMPVTLCLIYFYGISTLYIINHFSFNLKPAYLAVVACFLAIFTWVDKNDYIVNWCEKESLQTIAKSSEKIVFIENDCPVMYWGKVTDYHKSRWNTRYLKKMNIINDEKYYYQK